MKKLNVYLAGPDVFYPNAIERGQEKKKSLAACDLIGHYPLDNELPTFTDNYYFGLAIGRANERMMRICQVIMANMDPWHGPSMDVGTAFELGYMSGLAENNPDILIVGYYSNGIPPNFTERVKQSIYQDQVCRSVNGNLIGADGLTLEEFDMQDNLMLVHAIEKTGGKIFGSFEEAAANIQSLWAKKHAINQAGFMPMYDRDTTRAVAAGFGLVMGALTTAVALNSYSKRLR